MLCVSTRPEQRTNEDWIRALQSNTGPSLAAQSDLREYLKRGLRRALGPRDGLDESVLEDLTQDSMLRITIKLDRFRGDSRFTTWAMAVAIRVAYTELRKRRWADRSLEDMGISVDSRLSPGTPSPANPAGPTERADLLHALRGAIDTDLTPRQRAAVLGELAGMPTAVLADQLGTNPNALYKLHHDARLRLRTSLRARGISDSDVRDLV